MILRARFIVPVESPVIEGGVLAMDGGRITAVASASDLRAARAVDYGDAVILPGLVNAHTHLELSLLRGRVPPSRDFADWLRRLMTVRKADLERSSPDETGFQSEPRRGVRGGAAASLSATNRTARSNAAADDRNRKHAYFGRGVRAGLSESLSAGVTTLGDISAFPQAARPAMAGSPLRIVSFGEVIAIGRRRAELIERLDAAADTMQQTTHLRIGISPHAPYTVEPDALRSCVARARDLCAPLCIHVAETAEEEALTRHGRGPLASFLRDLGLSDEEIPVSDCSPVGLCARTGALGPKTILAHANYIDDEDMELIARSDASVAYCPRTHAAFGHAPHRFRDMLKVGINVCLGTDSLASNPSLSILEEIRFLRERCHDMAPTELLAMGTIRGARALGFGDAAGSLAPGKSADLVVLPLPMSAHPRWESVLDEPVAPLAVYVAGRRQSGSFNC